MKSPSPLPIVLVGCGAVSQQLYAPALLHLEKSGVARVVALVDPAESSRARLARRFPTARAVPNLESVTFLERGALAIVASPAVCHRDHVLAAARQGWHILCEKPLATTSAECAAMIKAAEDADVRLAVCHYRRFFSAARALKELCSGRTPLGPLMRFNVSEGGRFDWPAVSTAIFRREETPGGVLLDLGVDVLDLLVWWLGAPLDQVYADDAMGGLEINARLTLRFGAATGTVQLSRDWATVNRYTFEFARGRAVWTVNEANGLTVEMQGLPFTLRSHILETSGQDTDDHPQSFLSHLRQVVLAARDGSALPVDARAGARILLLIENCYARRKLIAQPWLTPEEEQSARRLALAKP
ncbi:MAG TPA: Gfo/Idh/MocA family oxidoreductase [Opitutaceae bacterium]|nr:Gfo/Idh/MocA family oxidoreductase [Opitutaceae bacterium]